MHIVRAYSDKVIVTLVRSMANYATMYGEMQKLGGSYDPLKRYWTLPNDKRTTEGLKRLGLATRQEVQVNHPIASSEPPMLFKTALPTSYKRRPPQEIVRVKQTEPPQHVARVKGAVNTQKLYPFQVEGVAFLKRTNGRALLADTMGLGKSAQAVCWLATEMAYPAVVVCPASLKINWCREFQMWAPGTKVEILNGTKPYHIGGADVYVINYDILHAWLDTLLGMKLKAVLADECHFAKNRMARRTKALMKLAKPAAHIVCISGTPITSRPAELYVALRMINKALFPSFWDFAKRYCGLRHNGWGYDYSGATNTRELHDILTGSIMIRRTTEEVLPQLPKIRRIVVPMQIDNESEYRMARDNFAGWLKEHHPESEAATSMAAAMAQVEYLKQVVVKGKLNMAVDWVHDCLDQREKIVLFAVHKEIIQALTKRLAKYEPVVIDGSTSMKHRQEAVDRFQNDPTCRVFIGNIKAAGTGITLTKSSATCFLELSWTSGDHDQCERRVLRIGTTASSVEAYYLLGCGTVEEDIAEVLDWKRNTLSKVLDGQTVKDENLLSALLKKYSSM